MNQLTEDTFEQTLKSFIRSEQIDLRGVSFIDPYGMLGLLEIGELCMLEDVRKTIILPQTGDVCAYLDRMDFFTFARRYFSLEPSSPDAPGKYQRSADSDVLLEITPIEKSNDIHFIVGKVRDRAQAILATHLHYDDRAINGFIVALSEVCQNIIEHSENKGFVGIQKYRFQNLNKNIVKIAVMDVGIGFRKSLVQQVQASRATSTPSTRRSCTARPATRTKAAVTVSPRSGGSLLNGRASSPSARERPGSPSFPPWARGKEQERGLISFPGSQINIMLPEV